VKKKEEINPNVYRYTFENKSSNVVVSKFYENLKFAGEGYTLT